PATPPVKIGSGIPVKEMLPTGVDPAKSSIVVAAGTEMSIIQTFYSRSDVIPLLSPSVDRPRQFNFNPGALRNYSDAYAVTEYSNGQIRLARSAISGSGKI